MTVESLNQFSIAWLDALWRASWQGALMAAAVGAACFCVKRIPQSVRYVLWLVVCAKMLLALSPTSVGIPVPANREQPTVESGLPATLESPATQIPAPRPYVVTPVRSETPRTKAPEPARPAWRVYVVGLWMFGAGASLLVALRSLARAYDLRRRSSPCQAASALQALKEASASAGLRRPPPLLLSEDSRDVLTMGFVNPAILLPSSVFERCTPDEIGVILAHECIHIRRADPQLGLIPQLAQIVFFFHPMVWLTTREINFSREAACDQAAMAAAKFGPDRYGRLLLALGARQDFSRTLCLPGVSSHFHLLRRRIAMLNRISQHPALKPNRSVMAAFSLTALLFVVPVSLVRGEPGEVKTATHKPAIAAHKAVVHKSRVKPQAKTAAKLPTTVLWTAVPAAGQSNGITMTVFSLQYAKAADTVAILKQAYKGSEMAIIADPRTNAVILRGTKAQITDGSNALTNLDQPTAQQSKAEVPRETKLFRMIYVNPETAAATVKETVGTRGAVAIVVDSRTNTLVVSASDANMNTIRQLLRELDTPDEQIVTRRVMVRFMKAEEIAKLIQGPLGHPKDLDITIDTRTNSLVVTATEDMINRVALMTNVFDVEKSN